MGAAHPAGQLVTRIHISGGLLVGIQLFVLFFVFLIDVVGIVVLILVFVVDHSDVFVVDILFIVGISCRRVQLQDFVINHHVLLRCMQSSRGDLRCGTSCVQVLTMRAVASADMTPHAKSSNRCTPQVHK